MKTEKIKMKRKLFHTALMLFLFLCLTFSSSMVDAASTVKLSGKTSKYSMYTGTTKRFRMKSAKLQKRRKKWSSSKKSVATISKKGIVKAKKPGKTVITCKIKGKRYRCKLTVLPQKQTVLPQKMTSLKITHSNNMYVGESSSLLVSISPQNTYQKKLSYTSSNPAVISVSQSGVVKAVGAGSAVITAKATDGSGKKSSCTIQVENKLTKNSVHYVAHRGLSSQAPENTKKAYILSKYQGDEDATRICTLKEYLEVCRQYNMVAIIELKISCGTTKVDDKGEELQTAEDLSVTFDKTMYNIDKTVAQIMGERQYVYISFDSGTLSEMNRIRSSKNESNMGLQFLTGSLASSSEEAASAITFCKTIDSDWNMQKGSNAEKAIAVAKQAGLSVNVWTVDDSFYAAQLVRYGADYITTNQVLW